MRPWILSSLSLLALLAAPLGCFDKADDEDDDLGGEAHLPGEDTAAPDEDDDEDDGEDDGEDGDTDPPDTDEGEDDDGGDSAPATIEEACEAYVVAVNACTEAFEEATGIGDTGGGVGEEACEEVDADLEQWLCVLEAMEAADCTTTEGLVQLSVEMARCLDALPGDTG